MNVSFSGFWAQYAPSIVLNDYHRARRKRVGVIVGVTIFCLNVGVALVACLLAVLGAL